MNRLRCVNPLRGLLVLALTLVVCVLGAGSATAAAPPKPAASAAAQDSQGSSGAPAGSSPCPSTASKPSSRTATCGATARSRAAAAAATASGGRTALPAGGAACESSHDKRSSGAAACSRGPVAAERLRLPYAVSLVASPTALAPGGTTTLTATANRDVGPSPFFIEIFDQTTHAFLADCAFGTTCSTTVTQFGSTVRSYVAYISRFGAGYPPPSVRAVSGTVTVSWLTVSLSASPTALTPGGTTTLSATASLDVGPTPYWIEIFDPATGIVLAYCGFGDTCSVSVTQPGSAIRDYVAYVSGLGFSLPPPNIRATSNRVRVTWLSISLSASPGFLWRHGFSRLTATASLDVGPTPYWIEIFDRSTGAYLTSCGAGTSCTTWVSQPFRTTHAYIAFISGSGTGFPPPNVRATSNTVFVTWF